LNILRSAVIGLLVIILTLFKNETK
jgi:hypothetical protein